MLYPFAGAEALADIYEQGPGGGVNFSKTEQSENAVNWVGCLDVTRNTSPIGMPPPDAGSEDDACNAIREGVHGGVKSAEDHRESVQEKNCTEQSIKFWRDNRCVGRCEVVDMCKKEEGNRNTVGGMGRRETVFEMV